MRYSISRYSLLTCSLCLLFSFVANAGQHHDALSLDHSTSVAGEDNNNNGVRDDVENYIDSLPDSEAQKNALKQLSRTISDAYKLGDSGKFENHAVRSISHEMARAAKCVGMHYNDIQVMHAHTKLVEKITANTPARAKGYSKFNRAISGHVIQLPRGDTCDD